MIIDLNKCFNTDISNLSKGDIFLEDCYPEIYKVTGHHYDLDNQVNMVDVELIDFLEPYPSNRAMIGSKDSFFGIGVIKICQDFQK